MVDWLDYNGYAVVTKPTKEFVDSTGRRKVKGNMDIELAVNAMEMAQHMDLMVLFSGDGDFRSLVEAVQRKGVRVAVVSTISTQPPMVADELRRQADEFIDLTQLIARIGRDPGERPVRTEDHRREPFRACPADRRRAGPGINAGPSRDAVRRRSVTGLRRLRRLAEFRAANRAAFPDWWNAPVPSFGEPDARLLIVGLAPGLRGANRTGRPFTGDYAGDLLYQTLARYGFATGAYDRRPDDGLTLSDCAIVNAVRACRRRTSRRRRRSRPAAGI